MPSQPDFYELLEVGKDAPLDIIKKQYRKLAKQYHPDRAKVDDAGEHFKLINNAYEVLSSPGARKLYDTKKTRPNPHGFRPQQQPKPAPPKPTYRPKRQKISIFVEVTLEEGFSGLTIRTTHHGTSFAFKCPRGAGVGRAKTTQMRHGQDRLYIINMTIKPHHQFTLDGIDMYYTLRATPARMFRSTWARNPVSIPMLVPKKMRQVALKTHDGQILDGGDTCLRHKGYIDDEGKRGDLHVVTKAVLPKALTDADRVTLTSALAQPVSIRLGMYLNVLIDLTTRLPRALVIPLLPAIPHGELASYTTIPRRLAAFHTLSVAVLSRLMETVQGVAEDRAPARWLCSSVDRATSRARERARALTVCFNPLIKIVSFDRRRHFMHAAGTSSPMFRRSYCAPAIPDGSDKPVDVSFYKLSLPDEFLHFFCHYDGYLSLYASSDRDLFVWGDNQFGQLGVPLAFPQFFAGEIEANASRVIKPRKALTVPASETIIAVHTTPGGTEVEVSRETASGHVSVVYLAGLMPDGDEMAIRPSFKKWPRKGAVDFRPAHIGPWGIVTAYTDGTVAVAGAGRGSTLKFAADVLTQRSTYPPVEDGGWEAPVTDFHRCGRGWAVEREDDVIIVEPPLKPRTISSQLEPREKVHVPRSGQAVVIDNVAGVVQCCSVVVMHRLMGRSESTTVKIANTTWQCAFDAEFIIVDQASRVTRASTPVPATLSSMTLCVMEDRVLVTCAVRSPEAASTAFMIDVYIPKMGAQATISTSEKYCAGSAYREIGASCAGMLGTDGVDQYFATLPVPLKRNWDNLSWRTCKPEEVPSEREMLRGGALIRFVPLAYDAPD